MHIFCCHPYYSNPSLITSNDVYVDGVSITYGSAPRKLIWTYANGAIAGGPALNCPYNNGNGVVPPQFVGSDYYCESGDNDYSCCNYNVLFYNDSLWDGQQCLSEEAPCCTHPNMPWFNKTLSETTTEDIELRVCGDQHVSDEDTLLQMIELFVRKL